MMENRYLILDSRGKPLARGISSREPQEDIWALRVESGDIERVMAQSVVSLISAGDKTSDLEGRVLRREGDMVYVRPLRPLEESVRQNLRMPVRFLSYMYPVSGAWKGRVPIVSIDLSCGGLAFFSPRPLAVGEVVQVVIPVTSSPLLLDLKILRERDGGQNGIMYAGRFVDLVHEQESMVSEAVFGLQLQTVPDGAER